MQTSPSATHISIGLSDIGSYQVGPLGDGKELRVTVNFAGQDLTFSGALSLNAYEQFQMGMYGTQGHNNQEAKVANKARQPIPLNSQVDIVYDAQYENFESLRCEVETAASNLMDEVIKTRNEIHPGPRASNNMVVLLGRYKACMKIMQGGNF